MLTPAVIEAPRSGLCLRPCGLLGYLRPVPKIGVDS